MSLFNGPLLAAATALPTFGPIGVPATAAKTVPNAGATLSPALLQQLQNAQQHHTNLASNYPWLTHTFAAIFVISAISLVLLLAFQTTKQEGLTGTLGGRVESNYRTRLGFDQQMSRITSIAAITFVLFGTLVSLSGI
jgi:protein translocase SecG subunit